MVGRRNELKFCHTEKSLYGVMFETLWATTTILILIYLNMCMKIQCLRTVTDNVGTVRFSLSAYR